MPHARSGEAVRLFVVRRDESLDEDEIQRHCRAHLAAYKCPKAIEFRESLPKNNIGKVLRRALREEAEA
jgi:long-chain acyl-CoA synthetase